MKKIDDLYFGISYWDPNNHCLKTANIFDFKRIKDSAARYIIDKSKGKLTEYRKSDPLMCIFGDVWGKCEWELIVRGMVESEENVAKVDIFSLFIKPNEKLLLSMIDEVSVNSAMTWRKKNK